MPPALDGGRFTKSCMKICTKCLSEKTTSGFSKNKSHPTGFCSECKECRRAMYSAWQTANPEKVKARNLAYKTENKEELRKNRIAYSERNAAKIVAASSAWYEKNADYARAKSIAYREKNPEKAKAAGTAWAAANPESLRIFRQNRRSRKRNAGGRLSKNLVSKLLLLQRGLCPCCKQPLGDDFHMDHIQPLAQGGSNNDENIQLLRKRCNLQKQDKNPVDFMQSRGFLL